MNQDPIATLRDAIGRAVQSEDDKEWFNAAHTALEQLEEVVKAAKQAAPALRVALHYTEADYDREGSDALLGCRVAETQLTAALQPFESTSEETNQ